MSTEDRVLLVDDQPMMGEVVRRLLDAAGGFDLRFVSNADDALAAAREFMPTVILQDIEMPSINGFDLLDAYRADHALADIPVLMLTSVENPDAKARAFESGASDYMVKFPDPIELVARVRRTRRARAIRSASCASRCRSAMLRSLAADSAGSCRRCASRPRRQVRA